MREAPPTLNPEHFPPHDAYGPLVYQRCHYCDDIYDQHDVLHADKKCRQAERDLGRG
jgi:hypothetical protein